NKYDSFAKDNLIAISQLFDFLSRKNIEQIKADDFPQHIQCGRLQKLLYRKPIDRILNRHLKSDFFGL
ncbi:MAG: hypothetical protein PVG34_04100, partial [Desulfobacterales bacterium]